MEMASSAGGLSANTQSWAVQIPHHDGLEAYSATTARQRRSARHHALDNLSASSDMGASSFSSENSSPASMLLPTTLLSHPKSSSSPRMRYHDGSRGHDSASFSPASSSFSEDNFSPQMCSSKDKAKAVETSNPPNSMPQVFPARSSPLGPSMLSSHTYKSINLNGPDPDEPPRLITFTKAGQGFNWNEELFLPSYMISRYARSRRKQYDGDLGEDDVEVAEIFVTDEEATRMMP
jgi:hypothetical protein